MHHDGENLLSTRTAQHWFNRFKNGNLKLDYLSRSDRPSETDMDLSKRFIKEDPRLYGVWQSTLDAFILQWKMPKRNRQDTEIWSLDAPKSY